MEQHKLNLMDKLANCIAACNQCYEACFKEEEHLHHMVDCIRTDRECADICSFTLSFISRESAMTNDIVELCAIACAACAAECEKHTDMEHCQACAQACHECEDACRHYLHHATA